MKSFRHGVLAFLLAALIGAFAVPAAAAAKTVKVTTTIQAAIAAASPGDVIVVPPGTYNEGDLLVTKDDLTIRGSKGAVLDASGHQYGVRVGAGEISGTPPVCPALSVHDFTMEGMTIRNADDIGLFMIGVDGFHVSGGSYLDNAEYGVFPRCSRDGTIEHNSGGGGEDATVYVGVDENVTVEKNNLTDGEIGVELENTRNSFVRGNKLSGNVAGVLIVVLPNLPTTSTENAVIEGNVIRANNLPNPFPPPPPFFDDLQLLPAGTGLLNVGGDRVTMQRNEILKNDSIGIGIIANPFGFGPPDHNRVLDNTVQGNGGNPDSRAFLSGDIGYDGSGTDNCFAGNVFKTDDPQGIVSAFPCP